METWFTSDTHFGHRNIIKYDNRPFENTFEHDEFLIKKWNETVAPKDHVYHLGDFSFHGRKFSEKILSRLHGKKFLIWGNHDRKQFDGFQEIYPILSRKWDGKKFMLTHIPFLTLPRSYSFQLHGHDHVGNFAQEYYEGLKTKGIINPKLLTFNVACNRHDYTPINLEYLLELQSQ
jgi:calcineurin-like phosphoesterase family protein